MRLTVRFAGPEHKFLGIRPPTKLRRRASVSGTSSLATRKHCSYSYDTVTHPASPYSSPYDPNWGDIHDENACMMYHEIVWEKTQEEMAMIDAATTGYPSDVVDEQQSPPQSQDDEDEQKVVQPDFWEGEVPRLPQWVEGQCMSREERLAGMPWEYYVNEWCGGTKVVHEEDKETETGAEDVDGVEEEWGMGELVKAIEVAKGEMGRLVRGEMVRQMGVKVWVEKVREQTEELKWLEGLWKDSCYAVREGRDEIEGWRNGVMCGVV